MPNQRSRFFTRTALLLSLASCYFAAVFPQQGQFSIDLKAETRHLEFANGVYALDWSVHAETKIIYFNVSVETLGYVGLGISRIAGMTAADIFIGGVNADGTSYFGDYYATKNAMPVLDASQDWQLLDFSENAGKTSLYFSRLLETCDENDVDITSDTLYLIWSYGVDDNIEYHGGENRGGVSANILDPPMPNPDVSKFDVWSITRRAELPAEDTVYWCTMHKRDPMEGKHYIVGFSPNITSAEGLKHTHHFIIYACRAPAGQNADELFGPLVGHAGDHCYGETIMPMEYCSSNVYVWALGGMPLFLPEHVGYPINEVAGDDYYIFEVHYDNPEVASGVTFDTGVSIYYTAEPRQYEAEILQIAYNVDPTHIIPPQSEAFTSVGHCTKECTQSRLPETGIKIFNILLHSHMAGRKLKLRHFRGDEELPWVANDDHYLFDYQQNRPLREEVTILPGDQLSYECVTNTEGIDKPTLGGLSTRHEMCQTFAWYYPKQNLAYCQSIYPYMDRIMDIFGIQNLTDSGYFYDPLVSAPPRHANKLYSQVLNEYNWKDHPQLSAVLQQELRYTEHYGFCAGYQDFMRQPSWKTVQEQAGRKAEEGSFVTYPDIQQPYVPPQTCEVNEIGSTTTTEAETGSPGSSTETSTPNSASLKMLSVQLCSMLLVIVAALSS